MKGDWKDTALQALVIVLILAFVVAILVLHVAVNDWDWGCLVTHCRRIKS